MSEAHVLRRTCMRAQPSPDLEPEHSHHLRHRQQNGPKHGDGSADPAYPGLLNTCPAVGAVCDACVTTPATISTMVNLPSELFTNSCAFQRRYAVLLTSI